MDLFSAAICLNAIELNIELIIKTVVLVTYCNEMKNAKRLSSCKWFKPVFEKPVLWIYQTFSTKYFSNILANETNQTYSHIISSRRITYKPANCELSIIKSKNDVVYHTTLIYLLLIFRVHVNDLADLRRLMWTKKARYQIEPQLAQMIL